MKYTPSFSFKSLVLLALFATVLFGGCKREYDSPPERTLPIGSVLTLEELRNLYVNEPIRFRGDSSVYAVVTADESSGNLYRNIFVQAGDAAINLRLKTPGGLYQGDSIRIYLPGTVLSVYQGMMQLDSVDVDNNVIKQATNVYVAPKSVTVNEITPDIQGQLIRLDSVEFIGSELNMTYSDPVGQTNQNRNLTDCEGNTILVRTSGYANFAGQQLPEGNGSFVAVVSQFSNDMQLFIRNVNEVHLTAPRCTGGGSGGECTYNVEPVNSINLSFDDITSDNTDYNNPQWLNIPHIGSRFWRGRIFEGSKYISSSSYNSGGQNQNWFISPPVIVNSPQVGLSFKSATAFWDNPSWDHPLTVYVSTDFDGCDINEATWTEVDGYTVSDSNTNFYEFIPSGLINVASFLPQGYTGNMHVAFVYNGSASGATTTLALDDITIQ